MNKTKELKAILYGMGTNFAKVIEYVTLRFIVIGCSDGNLEKEALAKTYDMSFISPEDIVDEVFDYILITSIYGEEIKSDLSNKYYVNETKILQMEEWQKMEFWHSFGSKNPDKCFYLISKPIRAFNGIVSLLYMYLDLLVKTEGSELIPVIDLQSYKNQYLDDEEVGKINAWDKFFKPISDYSVNDVLESQNVILAYDEPGYLADFRQKYNISRMMEVYRKRIAFNEVTSKYIQQELELVLGKNKNVIGVLYRGTDMTSLKLKKHMVQPTLSEICDKVVDFQKKYGCERVFVSTEDADALLFFKKIFADKLLYTNQKRYSNTGKDWIADIKNERENDAFLRGAEYLSTIYILSRCDYLVSGIVAGSFGALIMNNGKYKDVCIIDKGSY